MTFINRKSFTKRIFELGESRVKINETTLFDASEYEISVEHIDNKKKIEVVFNQGLFVFGCLFTFIGFLFLFTDQNTLFISTASIALTFFGFAFFNKKKVVTLSCYDGNKMELFYNNSNRQEIVNFADTLISAANNKLLDKFGRIDAALPIEPQLENIAFLRNREVITEEEYQDLKDQLLGRKNKSAIGFGSKEQHTTSGFMQARRKSVQ